MAAPDDLRAFVDRAHALGIGVILDVVYNHLGPDGNYLTEFSPDYFTDRYKNDWGRALNFEGPAAGARVLRRERRLLDRRVPFRRAAARRDAGHPRCVAGARAAVDRPRVRAAAPGSRAIYVVAENEPQDTRLVRARRRKADTASTRCGTTTSPHGRRRADRRREAYYTDYQGSAQEFISCAKYGYLYQGQWYSLAEAAPRHAGARSAAARLRCHISRTTIRSRIRRSAGGCTSWRRRHGYRALTALTLLGPATPMLFQGRSSPRRRRSSISPITSRSCDERFAKGRREFLAQFPSLRDPEVRRGAAVADRRSHVRALQAGSSASASATPRPTRCIATCLRCGATTR